MTCLCGTTELLSGQTSQPEYTVLDVALARISGVTLEAFSRPLQDKPIDKGSYQLCCERKAFDSSKRLDVDELGRAKSKYLYVRQERCNHVSDGSGATVVNQA